MTRRVITGEELRLGDGKSGAPALVAYEGIVYDVSESFMWRDGNHEVVHDAGMDLTEAMRDAPHFADVLDRFPRVGVLSGSPP